MSLKSEAQSLIFFLILRIEPRTFHTCCRRTELADLPAPQAIGCFRKQMFRAGEVLQHVNELTMKSENLRAIPGTSMVEGENQRLQCIL